MLPNQGELSSEFGQSKGCGFANASAGASENDLDHIVVRGRTIVRQRKASEEECGANNNRRNNQ